MRATFSGLELAKTGLTVSQLGLDVTGHNIANVDTLGYTRQRIVNTAYDPASTLTKLKPVAQAMVGGGARIKILDQIRSSFLDRQYRTENSLYTYYSTKSQGLTYVQSYFEGEAETTINDQINSFFEALNTASGDTVEIAQRVLVQQNGKLLAESFNDMYDGLIDIQKNQDQAVAVTVEQINTIAESIAALNKSIYSFELSENYANDLRDKRNLLLDELSAIVDIEYIEKGSEYDSRLTVKICGKELVSHTTVNKLGVGTTVNYIDNVEEGTKNNVYWLGSDGEPDLTREIKKEDLTSGSLKAYMDLRDGDSYENQGIPYYIEQLNTLARSIVQSINAIHRTGYTYPTEGGDSVNGVNFFWEGEDDEKKPITDDDPLDNSNQSDISKITAKTIKLSEKVASDAFNIACSSVEIDNTLEDNSDPLNTIPGAEAGNRQSGNNEKMREMFALFSNKEIKLITDKSLLDTDPNKYISVGSFDSFMSGITVDMATNLKNCNDSLTNRNILLLDAGNQRDSISGVSLDEEMTNLIKYQHAYTGASRVINAMDEAIDILINRTGRVGL